MNVLLVEDQALVRGALFALLSMEASITTIDQCANGVEALDILAKKDVDIVLSDIEMPMMNGIELIEKVAEQYPKIKTVIVTTFGRAGYIRRALDAGVNAFLLKDAPSDELVKTLQQVMLGKRVIDTELALMALDDRDPLSVKERKALKFAGDGMKTKAIAVELCLSEGTVRNYLSEAILKLNANNSIDAARIARLKGWL